MKKSLLLPNVLKAPMSKTDAHSSLRLLRGFLFILPVLDPNSSYELAC